MRYWLIQYYLFYLQSLLLKFETCFFIVTGNLVSEQGFFFILLNSRKFCFPPPRPFFASASFSVFLNSADPLISQEARPTLPRYHLQSFPVLQGLLKSARLSLSSLLILNYFSLSLSWLFTTNVHFSLKIAVHFHFLVFFKVDC